MHYLMRKPDKAYQEKEKYLPYVDKNNEQSK